MVYKALDVKLDRHIVLKFLPPDLTRDRQAKERFIIEAKAASSLDHPNVCTIYEINETADGHLFIAMAYYDGETLKEQVARGKLQVESVLEIAQQIASGLSRAHEAGIVHRDIKPSNLVITKRHEIKIIDFGLAKLAGQQHLTKSGATLGTVAYMSPEQAQGLPVDHRTDIWSLGVVMYEMLTGQLPFQGHYDQAVMYAIVNVDHVPLAQLRPDLPAHLSSVIDKALAKKPTERYQRVEDFLEDLQRARSGEKVKVTFKTSKQKKIRRGLFASVTLLGLIATMVLLRTRWFGDEPKPSPIAAASATANSQNYIAIFPFTVRGNEKYAYLREGMVDLLHSKLDWAGDLRVVDPSKLLSYIAKDSQRTIDSEQANRIAQHFEAGLFLVGSILETSGRLEVSASLYSVEHELRTTAQTAITDERHLIDGVDVLARKILTEQSNDPSHRFARVAGVTTKSFAALKAYLQGESKLRQQGSDFAAKEAFEQAVANDSTFALAWFRLSFAAYATNQIEQMLYASDRAAYWGRQLAKREQQLLQANYALKLGTFVVAERLYRDLVFAYPDDIEAWLGLGQTLFYYNPLQGRSMLESRPSFERVALLDDGHIWAKIYLFNLAVVESNAAEVDSLVNIDILRNSLQSPLYADVCQALLKNNHILWQLTIKKLRNESDFIVAATTFWAARAWLNGAVFRFEGQLNPAEIARMLATASSRSPDYRALAYLYLAQLELLHGKRQAAQKELKNLAALNDAWAREYRAFLGMTPLIELKQQELETLRDELLRWDATAVPSSSEPFRTLSAHNGVHPHLRLYLLRLLSARLQNEKDVEQYVNALTAMPSDKRAGSLAHDLALSVRAEFAQLRGQQTEALALLGQQKMEVWYDLILGSPFFPQILARFQRGEVLANLGRYEEALSWYNTTVYYPPDWILLAPNYLKRGKIYEKLGRTEQAIEHYTRFIRLWQDCDAELQPIVAETEKRLDRLKQGDKKL